MLCHLIVDGSSPLPRFLPTADSDCQPLFILRTGRGLGDLGFDLLRGSYGSN
jgi:hypothetical protein